MLIPIDIRRTLRAIRETFRDLASPQDPDFEARLEAAAAEAGAVDARGAAPVDYIEPLPDALRPRAPLPAMNPNEVVAYDLLDQHRFSRARLAEDGLLDDYRALGVSPQVEARWRGDFIKALIDGCGGHPPALEALMELAAEYQAPQIVARALDAMDDDATEYRVPDGILLNRCRMTLTALDAWAPEEAPELRRQALELARRLITRLGEADPGGGWRADWEIIRAQFAPEGD